MESEILLSNIPLFESLSPRDLATLAERLSPRLYEQGEVIFAAGDEGAAIFVIQDGGVEITTGEGQARTSLAQLFPGQFFGELSLLDGLPRSATATAMRTTRVLTLSREDFLSFLRTAPEVAIQIMGELGERLRQTNALFSRQVSKNVLEEADERLTFGQRVADSVASFGGSWAFIGLFGLLMVLWMGANSWMDGGVDPFPFILLNLALSTLASLQGPVIMMSQNRQVVKDKLLSQNDFQVNLKNELGIDTLLQGQAELVARITMIERIVQRRTTSARHTPPSGETFPPDPGAASGERLADERPHRVSTRPRGTPEQG